eukprot:691465-Karenia_brevis.AAC.1
MQSQYNNNRAPMITPPTAWFCSKCGLDHHNINMVTCRRPGCGGHNPAKPPIDVPPAKSQPSTQLIPPCSSSYLFALQQPPASSGPSFSPGIQQVATASMMKKIM